MKVNLKKSALKSIGKLQKKDRTKITKRLISLSSYPYSGKKLEGQYKDLRSLRVWPYRIIYEIRKNDIIVYTIKHRQSVYKQ